VIAGDTYNYYYYSDKPPQSQAVAEAQEKLEEKPPAEPAQETQADRYFDQAVKAFGAGDYTAATAKFHDAQQLSPDDIVLPFAHAQALFAGGEYTKAAEVLRGALAKSSPDKEGVFYPRGLYSNETLLQQQIEQLAEKMKQGELDADLELLLGYQLLGSGKHDEAASHLQSARLNANNTQAATTLINLLEKLQKPQNGSESSAEQQENTSADPQPQNAQVE
jgi:tetratricopeptide (TPR) repeat protein